MTAAMSSFRVSSLVRLTLIRVLVQIFMTPMELFKVLFPSSLQTATGESFGLSARHGNFCRGVRCTPEGARRAPLQHESGALFGEVFQGIHLQKGPRDVSEGPFFGL